MLYIIPSKRLSIPIHPERRPPDLVSPSSCLSHRVSLAVKQAMIKQCVCALSVPSGLRLGHVRFVLLGASVLCKTDTETNTEGNDEEDENDDEEAPPFEPAGASSVTRGLVLFGETLL